MSSFMIDNQELMLEWIRKVHKFKIESPNCVIGIVRNGRMIGAAVFYNYEERNIELACVGKGSFTRAVCNMLAKVAFDENDCERITVRVRSDNEYVLKVAQKFGWVQEGVMRKYYGDADCVVFGLLKQECRF